MRKLKKTKKLSRTRALAQKIAEEKAEKPLLQSSAEVGEKKLEELQELEMLAEVTDGLPHLHGFKWYKWARTVFESKNREIFLCAGNQLSKSATLTRKIVHLATEPELWKEFWPDLLPGTKPNLFWYFYPTLPVAHTEYETKWVPLYLPRGKFKDHPVYGWKPTFDKGLIHSIHFNSGVQIQFKTYSMKLKDLQTASVYIVGADEEMPVHYLPEIKARLNATSGYFVMVFTATLGQRHWEMTMEPATKAEEKHPDALKLQVSLFDCMEYEDGSPSPWTKEKIEAAIASCPTEAEVQRRVYGRFVKSHGLLYESFNTKVNICDPHPIPSSWLNYSAVDPGSGGQSGHPSAISFIAVSPDFKQGVVFRAWRGDGIATADSDTLSKYVELRGKLPIVQAIYDYGAKDFKIYADRIGEPFLPANKSREAGVGLLNTLFKNGMLKIFRGDPELEKIVQEITSLSATIDKRVAKDDLCDTLRYQAMSIPWDFSGIELAKSVEDELKKEAEVTPPKSEGERRREWFMSGEKKTDEGAEILEEFDFWNDMA